MKNKFPANTFGKVTHCIPRPTATRRRRVVVAFALLAASLGYAVQAQSAEILDIPPVISENLEPAVEKQLEQVHQALAEAKAAEASDKELADLYGHMGQLYVVYGLIETAHPAFQNANTLHPSDFRWTYYLGTIAQELRELEQAESLYRAALEQRPRDLPTLIRLGLVELELGDLEASSQYFERVLSYNDLSAIAYKGLAEIALAKGDTEAAARHFEAALTRQPQATNLHYQLALAYRDLGERDKARAEMAKQGTSEVAFVDPLIDDLEQLAAGAGVHIAAATQARANGQLDQAERLWQQAVAADPSNPTALHGLASLYAERNNLGPALEIYEALLLKDPDNAVIQYNAATVYLILGRTDEAITRLRRSIELSPDFVQAHFNLASALEGQARLSEAESFYRSGLALDGEDTAGRRQLAHLLSRMGRYDEAISDLDALLATDAKDLAAVLTRAKVNKDRSANQAAQRDFQTVVDQTDDPQQRATAQFELGGLLLEQDPQAAVTLFEAAAAVLSDHTEAWLSLANALGRTGQFGAAARAFDQAIHVDGQNPDAHFGRSISSLLSKEYETAQAFLTQTLSQFPDATPIEQMYARFLATCPEPQLRDGTQALAIAQRAFGARQTTEHAETLAMALAEVGRFEEAVELQQRLVKDAGTARRAQALSQALELYRVNQPCREPWLGGCRGQ